MPTNTGWIALLLVAKVVCVVVFVRFTDKTAPMRIRVFISAGAGLLAAVTAFMTVQEYEGILKALAMVGHNR